MPPTNRRRYNNPFQVVNPFTDKTTTSSLTFPNGTYLPPVQQSYLPPVAPPVPGNPTTAPIGGTGQFGALNPVQPVTNIPMSFGNNNFQQPSQSPVQYDGNALAPVRNQIEARNAIFNTPPPPSQQLHTASRVDFLTQETGLNQIRQNITNAESDFARFYESVSITGEPDFGLLPSEMGIATIKGLGLNADELAQLGYVRIPGSFTWVNQNKPGAQQIQTAGAGGGNDPNAGAAPFGRNSAGQRLDASGNVWDPNTAQRDIYGDRFVHVGEKRFVRNKRGVLQRQVLTKDGWKMVHHTRSGRKNAQSAKPATEEQGEKKSPLRTTGNFNTATG